MDQYLICGFMREHFKQENIHLTDETHENDRIYMLCYYYYQCYPYPYHVTFTFFPSNECNITTKDINKQLMNNHKYFTLRDGVYSALKKRTYILPHLTISDAAILVLSTKSYATRTEWNIFQQDLEMCYKLGIYSFIIICPQREIGEIKQFMTDNHMIDIKNVQFLDQTCTHNKKAVNISSKISEIISQINSNNCNTLNKEKQQLMNKPFLMDINNGFNKISNNNIFKVFTGLIIRGTVKIGDKVKFIRYKTKKSKKYQQIGTVKSIQIYNKSFCRLIPAKIGENIGIGIEFENEFDAGDSKGLLMDSVSNWSSNNIFEVEFTNISKEFLALIVKKLSKNVSEIGYYPRINCHRTIESGNQRKGCILKRVRLIHKNEVFDSLDTSVKSWGKSMYWAGYDAQLMFEGDIFVVPYIECKYFGSICMFYGCEKDKNHWIGKVTNVGKSHQKEYNRENIHLLIITNWVRNNIDHEYIEYPMHLKRITLNYCVKSNYPLNMKKLFNILSYDLSLHRMDVELNEELENIHITYGSNKNRGTYLILCKEAISNNKYYGINEIKIDLERLDDCFINIGIVNNNDYSLYEIVGDTVYGQVYEVNEKIIAYVFTDFGNMIRIKNGECQVSESLVYDCLSEGETVRVMIDSGNYINWYREFADGYNLLLQKTLINEFEKQSFYFFIEFGAVGYDAHDHSIAVNVIL
eukprot:117158_1